MTKPITGTCANDTLGRRENSVGMILLEKYAPRICQHEGWYQGVDEKEYGYLVGARSTNLLFGTLTRPYSRFFQIENDIPGLK